MILNVNSNNFKKMKDSNIPLAIIISSVIISASIFITFAKDDPLKTCMKTVMKENRSAYWAAKACSGGE